MSLPGLSWRHLWQDEIETAERARTILDSGLPRVIDRNGHPTLNTGGRELEDSDLHRYTPWLQFYVGAAGLAGARAIGASEDAGVRFPFALSHVAASSLLSYGLTTLAGFSAPAAALISVGFGLQTVRVAHGRTARYHALLDVLTCVGLVGLGGARKGRRWGAWMLAIAIFALPQTHTLGGGVMSVGLGALAIAGVWSLRPKGSAIDGLSGLLRFVALPGVGSVLLILLLTRPWAQGAWGAFGSFGLRSVRPSEVNGFALAAMLLGSFVLIILRQRRAALALGAAMLAMLAAMFFLDAFPFSQWRYYLPLTVFAFGWPLALGVPIERRGVRGAISAAILVLTVIPELLLGSRVNDGLLQPFRPFAGIRLAFNDWKRARRAERQPLHEAVEIIRREGRPNEAVLFDYVPQFINWYLPDRVPALVPDPSQKTILNAGHPAWSEPAILPEWHLWYPTMGGGFWVCGAGCNYTALGYSPEKATYVLATRAPKAEETFCIVRRWTTEKWNNAPFMNVSDVGLTPSGGERDVMVLARKCAPAN